MTFAATIFFAAWARVVQKAGSSAAIPIVGKWLPESWRAKIDKTIGKVGK